MSEEEKEAIDKLNEFLKRQFTDVSNFCYGISKKHIGKITLKEMGAIDILLNLIQKQQAEIEKKDKVIDEMADCINCSDALYSLPDEVNSRDTIKDYFYKKVEESTNE